DEEITQQNDFHGLEPPGLRRHAAAEILRHYPAHPVVEVHQEPDDYAAPEQILAKKETQVGRPSRPKETLPRLGRKDHLQWAEYKEEECKTKSGGGECDHAHGSPLMWRPIGNRPRGPSRLQIGRHNLLAL